jgi:hypothetical protein
MKRISSRLRETKTHVLLRGDRTSEDCIMKRSRRVVLTMMGSATIGAVSMGFVRRRDCGPGLVGEVVTGLDGTPVVTCRGAAYGGFGHFPHHFHGHGGG